MPLSEFPTTENGVSLLVNAEWHGDQCKVNQTRKYLDCDCSLSRAIAAAEREAVRNAVSADADQGLRVALAFIAEWANDCDDQPGASFYGFADIRERALAALAQPPAATATGSGGCVVCKQGPRGNRHKPQSECSIQGPNCDSLHHPYTPPAIAPAVDEPLPGDRDYRPWVYHRCDRCQQFEEFCVCPMPAIAPAVES